MHNVADLCFVFVLEVANNKRHPVCSLNEVFALPFWEFVLLAWYFHVCNVCVDRFAPVCACITCVCVQPCLQLFDCRVQGLLLLDCNGFKGSILIFLS